MGGGWRQSQSYFPIFPLDPKDTFLDHFQRSSMFTERNKGWVWHKHYSRQQQAEVKENGTEAPVNSGLQNQDGYSPGSHPDAWAVCSQTTLIKQPLVSLVKAIPWGGLGYL